MFHVKNSKKVFHFSFFKEHFFFCLISRLQNVSENFILMPAVSSSPSREHFIIISETLSFGSCPAPINLFLISSSSSLTRPLLSSKNTSHPTHCRESFRLLKRKTEDKEQQQKTTVRRKKKVCYSASCLFGFGFFGVFFFFFF